MTGIINLQSVLQALDRDGTLIFGRKFVVGDHRLFGQRDEDQLSPNNWGLWSEDERKVNLSQVPGIDFVLANRYARLLTNPLHRASLEILQFQGEIFDGGNLYGCRYFPYIRHDDNSGKPPRFIFEGGPGIPLPTGVLALEALFRNKKYGFPNAPEWDFDKQFLLFKQAARKPAFALS